MMKLPKLPERAPVRITLTLPADLHVALGRYASLYEQTYGRAESVSDLIPYMLEAFLESDRVFQRARSAGGRSEAK